MSEGLNIAEMDFDGLIAREWIVSNGLGGYASSTASGMNSRRYHGLLVAAMSPPVRRMVLLSRLEETLISQGREHYLACNEYPGVIWPRGHEHLRAFSTEPFPRWAYQGDGWTIEKQLRLIRDENTVLVSYTLLGGSTSVELELRPLLALRGIHELTYQWNGRLVAEARSKGHWHVPATSRTPEVFFAHDGAFEKKPNWYLNTIYRREPERGYSGLEDLWCPGVVRMRLSPGQPMYFACSADPFELPQAVARAGRQLTVPQSVARPRATAPTSAAEDADIAALSRAAETFVLRDRDGSSTGCTVQYPWSAPSPRAALAAFAGLYLVPGKFSDARSLLQTLVGRLENGLLPSEFPENAADPIYEGVDISLWFVNAVYQYISYTGDEPTVRRHLFEPVLQIIDSYRRGTSLGIKADEDGLIVCRAPGVGATWMDARQGDWVVTPRHGRAVEINALWYNALCATAELARKFDRLEAGARLADEARRVKDAFNRRFWNEATGCCFDVVDDDTSDGSIRPNQLLAASLPFPVLTPERQAAVLDVAGAHLLTSFGLRTLSPRDEHYQRRYVGGPTARDLACHNGSAFPWLLGPFVTTLLRVRGRTESARADARRFLEPCLHYLCTDGMGQLCELFDGDAPQTPGGSVASPLSVGELLRCYAENVLDRPPTAWRREGATTGPQPAPATPNVPNRTV